MVQSTFDELEVVLSNARANIPPSHPQLVWQNSCCRWRRRGATDDGVADGIRDGGNCVIGSVMKLSMTTMLGRGRRQAHFDNGCDDGAVGYSGSDDEDDDGAAITEPMLATTSTMMMSIRR